MLSMLVEVGGKIAIYVGQKLVDKYLFKDKYKPKHLKR